LESARYTIFSLKEDVPIQITPTKTPSPIPEKRKLIIPRKIPRPAPEKHEEKKTKMPKKKVERIMNETPKTSATLVTNIIASKNQNQETEVNQRPEGDMETEGGQEPKVSQENSISEPSEEEALHEESVIPTAQGYPPSSSPIVTTTPRTNLPLPLPSLQVPVVAEIEIEEKERTDRISKKKRMKHLSLPRKVLKRN